MKYKIFYEMTCMAYNKFLRDLLLKAVDDPDSDWDDILLSMLDRLFGYEE